MLGRRFDSARIHKHGEIVAQNLNRTERWFLWMKRKYIADGTDVIYLKRWIIFSFFGWKVMVHQILQSDHDRCLHDHPWGFFGFILWGGYIEDLPNGVRRTNKPFRFINRMNPQFTHRIHRLLKKSSWTILIRTPAVRQWGFYTPEGWLHWRKFLGVAQGKRVAWCGTEQE